MWCDRCRSDPRSYLARDGDTPASTRVTDKTGTCTYTFAHTHSQNCTRVQSHADPSKHASPGCGNFSTRSAPRSKGCHPPFVCTLPSDIRTNRPRVDPVSYLPLQATFRVPIYGRVRQSRLQVRRTHAQQISKRRSPRLQFPLPAPIRRLCECVYMSACV